MRAGTSVAVRWIHTVPGMTFLVRLGAVTGLLSALCIAVPGAVEAFTGETLATSMVIAASPALAVPLLVALHIGQMRSAGRLGRVGFAVNLIGLGLFGGAAYALNVALAWLAVALWRIEGPWQSSEPS
jgi:hypothetical protein